MKITKNTIPEYSGNRYLRQIIRREAISTHIRTTITTTYSMIAIIQMGGRFSKRRAALAKAGSAALDRVGNKMIPYPVALLHTTFVSEGRNQCAGTDSCHTRQTT